MSSVSSVRYSMTVAMLWWCLMSTLLFSVTTSLRLQHTSSTAAIRSSPLLLKRALKSTSHSPRSTMSSALSRTMLHAVSQEDDEFSTVRVPLGDGYQSLDCKFRPIFQNSEFFTVTYPVPFGLNVEKPPRGFPAPIVSKAGKGGEQKGDILRATTCWSQGFNAAGATSDILSFAGNIKWRKSVFDVTGAPWDEIVRALVSNTAERSQEVTLVFERNLDESVETPQE